MKRKLLKVIGISFLIFVVLSWLIPVGTYSSGQLTTKGIDPVGLIDLFNKPIQSFVTFVLYGVVFATIGGLYGVMGKTGALDKVVTKMSNDFSGKETKFLVLTVVLFAVLSSVTGLVIPLFVLVPLFAAVLITMGYESITAMAATVGGLLIGSVASTYGFNITGYTKNILSVSMSNQIGAKVILLVILTAALAWVVVFSSKKAKKEISKHDEVKEVSKHEEVEEVSKEEAKVEVKKADKKSEVKKAETKKTSDVKGKSKPVKKNGKKGKSNTRGLAVTKPIKKVEAKSRVSATPMMVIFILMLVLCLVGMYNWYYSFGIDAFNKMHEAIVGVKIKGFPIFKDLFNGFSQLGYWSNIEFVGAMIISSGIIAWIYKLDFNEFVESFIAGVKKWMPTAIYAALASVILSILYQASYNGTGTLVNTFNAKIFGLSDGFNVVFTGVSALISSFFFNDLYYLLASLSAFVTGFSASSLSVAGLLIQSMYAIGMMIFPTSVVLIAGLSLFDVSYKKWMKYIWKFALATFLLVLLVCGILTLL